MGGPTQSRAVAQEDNRPDGRYRHIYRNLHSLVADCRFYVPDTPLGQEPRARSDRGSSNRPMDRHDIDVCAGIAG